jgi:uncharacterized coiled-coil DUF342 family protein
MTTVTENLDRARKIRDERKAKLVEYIAVMDRVSDLLDGFAAIPRAIREANNEARALRKQIGGRK